MKDRSKITMKDVARLARVSTSTVSAVINGTVPVSPARAKRVNDAMTALEYYPDAVARGLKTGRSAVIGVVVPDLTNVFYPEVVRGIEDAARGSGYGVLLCDSSEDPSNEEDHLKMLFSRRVDGVLLACCAGTRAYSSASIRRLPIVFLDRIPPVGVDYSVSSDNIQAGHIATRHLIELGHKKIAFIAGHTGLSPHHDRLEGFRKAMQEAHLPVRGEYMSGNDMEPEDGKNACARMLSEADPPTAIMAGNNKLLLGVLSELDSRGVQIPSKVSLLGFDDYLWNRYFNPSLTAVSQATYQLGKCSFDLLVKAMNGTLIAGESDRHIRIATELRVRNSTASPEANSALSPKLA